MTTEQGRLLRRHELARYLGNKDPNTATKWIATEGFPQPIILNPGARRSILAWRLSAVDAWLSERPRGAGVRPHDNLYKGQRRARQERSAAMGANSTAMQVSGPLPGDDPPPQRLSRPIIKRPE